MLVEHGFVRAQLPDGREWTFTPSIGRIAELGTPEGVVELYAALHGPRAERVAREVLAALCDQDDPIPFVGGLDIAKEAPPAKSARWWAFWSRFCDEPQTPARFVDVQVPPAVDERELVILARHLMQHGICGKPDPAVAGDGGSYSSRFDASQFIAMARTHLGMTKAEAAALSMTELQQLMAAKSPPQEGAKGAKNVPTRAEYEAAMKRLKERRGE